MAFTYTAGSTAERDRVRLEIGDTDADRVLFQDAELDDFLTQEGESILGSAARACETLAVRFARDFTFSSDGSNFGDVASAGRSCQGCGLPLRDDRRGYGQATAATRFAFG